MHAADDTFSQELSRTPLEMTVEFRARTVLARDVGSSGVWEASTRPRTSVRPADEVAEAVRRPVRTLGAQLTA
jgi:hypothetical protein